MMVCATAPSTTKSSTPVTVTVCGEPQFALVNVTLDGLTVPSAVFELVRPTVTFAVVCAVSAIENVTSTRLRSCYR